MSEANEYQEFQDKLNALFEDSKIEGDVVSVTLTSSPASNFVALRFNVVAPGVVHRHYRELSKLRPERRAY